MSENAALLGGIDMLRRKKDFVFRLLFLLGIAAGTAAGVWQREWITEQICVGRGLFYLQLAETDIPDSFYLVYLLKKRGTELAALVFFVYTGWYEKVLAGIICFIGIWCGLVITALTFLYGMIGFVFFGLAVFPHFLIYGFGSVLLYEFSGKRMRFGTGEQVKLTLQIACIFIVGMVGEAWIQPVILERISNLVLNM